MTWTLTTKWVEREGKLLTQFLRDRLELSLAEATTKLMSLENYPNFYNALTKYLVEERNIKTPQNIVLLIHSWLDETQKIMKRMEDKQNFVKRVDI